MIKGALVLVWVVVFVALDLYANLVPLWWADAPARWFVYAGAFFVLAWLAGRFALGVQSLAGFGLGLGRAWGRELGIGFALGAGVWLLKNAVFFAMGKFQVAGWMDGADMAKLMAQAAIGMLLASAINDLLIRGYWFAWCRRAGRLRWFVVVATVLYVLDDGWNAGFAPLDLAFSTVLGIALAWTVLKTGRIWMSIGIHWGGNMVYRAMSGFDGHGVIALSDVRQGERYELVAIAITALLMPAVWFLLRERRDVAPIAEAA